MGNSIGVIATVGEDPGLTPAERVARTQQRRWENVLAGSQLKLKTLEARMINANPSTRAALEVKAEAVRQEISNAECKLLGMVN